MPTRLAGSKPWCRVEPLPGSSWARVSGRVQGPKPGSCIPGRERMQQGQTGGDKGGDIRGARVPFPMSRLPRKDPPPSSAATRPPLPCSKLVLRLDLYKTHKRGSS